MKFTELQPGDNIQISKRGKRGSSSRTATVVQSTSRFIVIDYGEYKGTVSIQELKNGDYRIKFLQRGEEDMGTKLDVDHEKLLEICKQHGTGKEGVKAVMEHFVLTQKQAENQIYLQKIRRELDAGKAAKQHETIEVVKEIVEEEKVITGVKCEMEGLPGESVQVPGSNLSPVISNNEISNINIQEEHMESMTKDEICEAFNVPVSEVNKIDINIGNFIDRPLPIETEEYPATRFMAEVAETVRESVSEAAKEAVKKIGIVQDIDEMMEMIPEAVNHPAHYNTGNIEVIDYLQDNMSPEKFEGFCIGNALKYLSRYDHKGGVSDIKKAQWYLDRIIKTKEAS